MQFFKTTEKVIKSISIPAVSSIINTVIAACAVLGIFVSICQVNDNHKLLEINNDSLKIMYSKYLQENRPYIYFDSVEWIGKQNNLFDLELKNPGQFPANITLTFDIKDSSGNEIYKDNINNIVIFPYNQNKKITIGYNTLALTSKSNPDKKIELMLNGKTIKKVQEMLNTGEKLDFIITAEYFPLLEKKNTVSSNFKYLQKFLLYKSASDIILKSTVIDAD